MARRQVKREEAVQRRYLFLSIFSVKACYCRITIMVVVIVSAFLFCWFPFAIMFAGTPFSPNIGAFFVNNNLEDTVTWLGIKVLIKL